MDERQRIARADLRADRQQAGDADGMVDGVVRPRAAAAQRHHGKADVAGGDASDKAVARRPSPASSTGACGRYSSAVLDEIGRAAERRAPSGRNVSAAAPLSSASVARRSAFLVASRRCRPMTSISAASASVTSTSRRSRRRPVRKSTAFATSTALPAADASGSFMPVISAEVLRPAPLATSTRLVASSAASRLFAMKAPLPTLTSSTSDCRPGGELLRQDRGGDQRHRFDRRGDVADGVETLVGGRERRRSGR